METPSITVSRRQWFRILYVSAFSPHGSLITARSKFPELTSHTAIHISHRRLAPNMSAMTSTPPADIRSLIVSLYDVGAVKFGTFTLKSGQQSPYYLDLRVTISHPKLLEQISVQLLKLSSNIPHDVLCGVPYTALPFATAMSLKSGVGMIMRRKETKDYGMKRTVEGELKKGATCLVVEDLVTSGGSVLETVEVLEEVGLIVKDCIVVVDREQGGVENLSLRGIRVKSVVAVSDMLEILVAEGRVSREMKKEVDEFIAKQSKKKHATKGSVNTLGFGVRANLVRNSVGRTLLNLMERKKTCLAVAADVTTEEELLKLADKVGPEICILKTHADIISDWDEKTGVQLRQLADRHNFLIFEDRKFADIGNTVVEQCAGGNYQIAFWADIINAHTVPGPGIIAGLKKASLRCGNRELGLILLAEMSSKGNLTTELKGYTLRTVNMAKENREFAFGFISMGKVAGDDFVYLTPGVKMDGRGDSLGQTYRTPAQAMENGSDVIIVGRGIYQSDDPRRAAAKYREEAWKAYIMRCRMDTDEGGHNVYPKF